MNKYNGLLIRAANEFGIVRGGSEDEKQWKMRIIYSILGRMALASLYDMSEDEDTSITHMKRRVERLAVHYKEMFPEVDTLKRIKPVELADEIYKIYLNAGVIYHKINHVVTSAKTEIALDGVKFTRGYEIEAKQMLSGLGTYVETDDMSMTNDTLSEMYQLEPQTLSTRWKLRVRNASWQEFHSGNETQYLRMGLPFRYGYWTDKPVNSGKVSILRTGLNGMQLYYLYKVENQRVMASQLPQWQVDNKAYRSLAAACLYQEGVLPPSMYHYDGDLVYLSFEYLPSPAELSLWKLYTWPPISIRR